MPSRFAWVLGLALQVSLVACGPQETSVERLPPGPQGALTQLAPGTLPDLVVRRLSLPPAVRVGRDVYVGVEVCNRMPFPAGPFVVEVRLSQSRDSTSTDPTLLRRAVDGLGASACARVDDRVMMDAALAGAHFVAAVVDPDGQVEEADEANNVFQGETLGVGDGPDFVITAFRAPAVVEFGRPIVATATVCNRGTLVANAAVDLLLSEDAVLTADDKVETWTGGLFIDPGGCEDVELHVSRTGHFMRGYVGALVNAYPGELHADLFPGNNLWVGGQLTFAEMPDLIVTKVDVPSSVTGTMPFWTEVTVCNQGTRSMPAAFEVELLLSAHPVVVAEDRLIGSAQVAPLAAGQCARTRVEASVPGIVNGTWYVGAVANARWARWEEAFWDNNVGPASRILVGEAPDFRIVALEAPGALSAWADGTARVTVCNDGTVGAPVDVGLYWSADEELVLPEPSAGSLGFGFLAPGQCATEPVSIHSNDFFSGPRYLLAFADAGRLWAELDEDNNTFVGKRVFLGLGYDLAVTSLEAPASVHELSRFMVRATVCNQGNTSSSAGYLSIHSRMTRGALWAESLAFQSFHSIDPGVCVRHDVPVQLLYARPMGLLLEAHITTYDAFEENEPAPALVPVNVGDWPDLMVTSVVAPAGVSPGQGFFTDVTVCNQGLRDWSTDVMVVLSQDADITVHDLFAGWAETGLVQAGQCVSIKVPSHAGSLWPGVFTVGAIVDPYPEMSPRNELRVDNNALAGGQVSLGRVADFAVTAVSAPKSVAPGAAFTAKVTVCNEGAARGSTDVAIVLARTSRISRADLPLGGMPVGSLERGQCVTREVLLTAPSAPTQGVLGALVDSLDIAREPREDNNALAGGPLSVGVGPDFSVDIVELPSSQPPDVPFTTKVRVCNGGTSPAEGGVHVFLSANEVIDEYSDALQGSHVFDVLAPGQCQLLDVPVEVSSPGWALPAGRWYWGAKVVSFYWEPDLHWDDNVDVRPLNIGMSPDFAVTGLEVPSSVLPGQAFAARVTVCNAGTLEGSTPVRLVRDWSPFYAPAQHTLGEAMTESLVPGQCSTVNVQAHSGVSFEGLYSVSAVANPDGAWAESREDDNVRTARLGVGALPDFTVGSVRVPVTRAASAEDATIAVQMCNVGTVAGEAELALVLSVDATITAADMPLSAVHVGPLASGTCTTVDVPVRLWVPSSGVWYVGAVVDPYGTAAELRRDNNTSQGVPVGIGALPDFVVTRLSMPPSVDFGMSLPALVEVCNVGAVAGDVDVSFYQSSDEDVTPQDILLETWSFGTLSAGRCASAERALVPRPPDRFPAVRYIGALADAGQTRAELSETNNGSPVVPVSIGSGPDLVIRRMDAPSGVRPGASFQVATQVCNQGNQESYYFVVLGYFARSGAGASRGMPAWDLDVPYLPPGRCVTLVSTVTTNQGEGLWFLSSELKRISGIRELSTDNNTGPVHPVRVGQLPDFVVTSVEAPTVVRPADAFQVDVTVCNQGTVEAHSDVTVFLSRDPSHSVEDGHFGPVPTGALGQGQCATLPVTVPGDSQRSGTGFVGALVDRSAQVSELAEENNVHDGVPVRFAALPDFVVTSVGVPESVAFGGTFPARLTVCNQGTASGSAVLTPYLSLDAVISRDDVQVAGSMLVEGLAPGTCALREASIHALPSREGEWYFGAVVDAQQWGEEASTANNASVGRRMGIGFKPDLVVTAVDAPAAARPDAPLAVSATVCNQGTTPVSNALLGFSVHPLPEVRFDQGFSATDTVSLSPGACRRVARSLYLPPEVLSWSSTYVVAFVDPDNGVAEFNEHNNEGFSQPISVVDGLADLVTEAVRAPATMELGQPFTGTVRVCNEGRGPAPAWVALHASRLDQVTSEDPLLGEASLGTLAPGQCAEHAIPAVLDAAGTFFLGAVSSTRGTIREYDETNNVGPVLQVYVEGTGTDFVTESAVLPSVVFPDATFTASVRVCNRGGLDGVTSVSLFLSADALVDATDTELDQRSGLFLPAGRCEVVPLRGQVSQPGRWYVAAIADPLDAQPEDDDANNRSPVSALLVGEMPDYVIAALKAPQVESSNGPLPVRITVCNQGNVPGQATFVYFQLRASGTVANHGLRAPYASVPPLGANQCAEWEHPLGLVGVAARAWRLEAELDPEAVLTEAHLDNNFKAVDLRVGNHAELSVTRIAPERNALSRSESFITEVTVCNTGSVAAGELRIHVLMSEDGLEPDEGVSVGTRPFSALAKGCAVVPVIGNVPAQLLGEVHVKARVELVAPQGGELNLDDNALVGPVVGIGFGPDLVVTGVTTDVSVAWPSALMPAVATVCNRGDARSMRAPLDVFPMWAEARDPVPASSLSASVSIQPLEPDECSSWEVELNAPPVEGSWRLIARVDGVNAVRETVESNNLGYGDLFHVTTVTGHVVTALQAPTAVWPNEFFTSTATVCNRGPTWPFGMPIYLALETEDGFPVAALAARVTPSNLATGACAPVTLSGWAHVPQEGAYLLVARMGDPAEPMSESQRRALSFAVPLVVGGSGDFAVTAVSGPATVREGASYSTSVTVCNRGTSSSSAATVYAYLSRDERVDVAGDVRVGQTSVTLSRNQCRTLTVSSRASVDSGDVWFVGANVSMGSPPDVNPSNDGRVGSRIIVTP